MTSGTDKKQDQRIKDLQKQVKELEAKDPATRTQEDNDNLSRMNYELTYGPDTDKWPEGAQYLVKNKPEPKPQPTPDPDPNPPVTEGDITPTGIKLPVKIKQGGMTVSAGKVERSSHGQTGQSNIPRDSIYGVPQFDKTGVVDFATYGYFNVNLTANDQIVFKRDGGAHSDSVPKQGKCYGLGVQVNIGKATFPLIEKEYPQHSTTPKFSDRAQNVMQSVPDINNKTVGIITIGYKTQDTRKFSVYIDTSALDKDIESLTEPPNNWVKFFDCEDKGDWTGDPYMENNGLANAGQAMMFYCRVDHVGKATKAKFAGAIEIVPT